MRPPRVTEMRQQTTSGSTRLSPRGRSGERTLSTEATLAALLTTASMTRLTRAHGRRSRLGPRWINPRLSSSITTQTSRERKALHGPAPTASDSSRASSSFARTSPSLARSLMKQLVKPFVRPWKTTLSARHPTAAQTRLAPTRTSTHTWRTETLEGSLTRSVWARTHF